MATIYEDICNALNALKTQKNPLPLPLGRDKERALVVGGGLEIGAIAYEGIEVPSMRKHDFSRIIARILLRKKELPTAIQRVYFSCRSTANDADNKGNIYYGSLHSSNFVSAKIVKRRETRDERREKFCNF